MSLRFYEYDGGMIVCHDCLQRDLEDTRRGRLTGDERVYPGMYRQTHDPALQCDGCLVQSDDYDDYINE